MKIIPHTEEQLVRDLQAGRSTAFTSLYDSYAPALFGVLLRLVKDQQQAEDLLQDAFIKIWTNIHRYDANQGRLFTWLLTITRNVALDELRTRKVQAQAGTYMYERSNEPSYQQATEAMPHQPIISVLAPQYGQIVELVYQGYTREEIAETYNLPLGTVKTRFRTAIQKLKYIFRQDLHHYHMGHQC